MELLLIKQLVLLLGVDPSNGFNRVNSIFIQNAGKGYTLSPTVTIAEPETISGIGNFEFNEVVQGMRSGTQARVKNWDSDTGVLSISNVSIGGTISGFFAGEDVKGLSSGALYSVSRFNEDNTTDKYNEGDIFETEADSLLDFTESNPFGTLLMLGNYFYHEIIRKTVIAFGTLFNDIHVRHQDQAGNDISDIKVPVAYGPRQKFLARITQQAELNKATQITLPRMSFEITNISYDSSRKAGITQTFKAADSTDGNKMKKVFMPVPYNLGFELNILVKLQDDGLQILEQILPFFQPSFTLSIDLVKSIGEKRDIPMVLNSINSKMIMKEIFQPEEH